MKTFDIKRSRTDILDADGDNPEQELIDTAASSDPSDVISSERPLDFSVPALSGLHDTNSSHSRQATTVNTTATNSTNPDGRD
jgi:hypothetical protein